MSNKLTLMDLPTELIELICDHLTPNEFNDFRLLCRKLNEQSRRQFFVRHFRVCQFMLTKESLETLVSFSKNAEIAPCIKELQLRVVIFSREGKRKVHGLKFSPQEGTDFQARLATMTENESHASILKEMEKQIKRKRRRAYGRHETTQNTMCRSGQLVEILAEALRGLSALESIRMVNDSKFSHPPWGARQLVDDIRVFPQPTSSYRPTWGRAPNPPDEDLNMSIQALATILGAIESSGTCIKKRFAIHGAPYAFNLPKTPQSRRLASGPPASTFCESRIPDLQPHFADLQELTIDTHFYGEDCNNPRPLDWLTQYSALTSTVQLLIIHGSLIPQEFYILKMLSATTEHFPHLRGIRLLSTAYLPAVLSAFICNRPIEHVMIGPGERECMSPFNNDRVEREGHLQLLYDLVDSPTMRSLNIVEAKRQGRFLRRLPAISTCVPWKEIHLETATPEEFQVELKYMLHCLRKGQPQPPSVVTAEWTL